MNFLQAVFKAVSGNQTSISPTEAHDRINSDQPPFILDVRQANEYQTGHIAHAKLIPLDQLATRMKDIPQDRDILCVCRSGARSGMASRQLRQAGYQVVNLKGGMMAWSRAGLPVKKGK